MPWLADHERRTIFFKYSPSALTWSGDYFDAADYANLTEREEKILAPPGNKGAFQLSHGIGRDYVKPRL
jgi:hypothetical protein